uniref:Probable methylthioribulose-1-phosphate dehydratase n=1 Tax=Moina brachiata TaxID=675436 RepID=A0A4Y7NJ46_9CRUS|nr:EOG090X0D1G [Moina brachiata]SVE93251.1 EOG090X0D1G [Moina brachiata]
MELSDHSGSWAEENEDAWDEHHPRVLIPEMCKLFYTLGWVTGTGGGMSIKRGPAIYIAPSGVQKERIKAEDLFIQDMNGQDLKLPPPTKKLKKSQCTPLFMCAYTERGAGAVIHTHSKAAVLVTLLCGAEFRISRQEMIKGIWNAKLGRNYNYDEELVVPVIENTCWESDLESYLREAIEKYPETSAVLVRRHGIYVWGKTWEQTKAMCECYDYLMDLAVSMKQLNIPWV